MSAAEAPPNDIGLAMRARNAHERAKGLGSPTYYRPTVIQWEVLFALMAGPLATSHITITGAHVAQRPSDALERRGLVEYVESPGGRRRVKLTEAGRKRTERGW